MVKKSRIMPQKSMMIFHQSEPAHTPPHHAGRKEGRKDGWMKYSMWTGNIVLSQWFAVY
jgi:hypothetical protein